jgi:uncharacterized delta-60 repeat protein
MGRAGNGRRAAATAARTVGACAWLAAAALAAVPAVAHASFAGTLDPSYADTGFVPIHLPLGLTDVADSLALQGDGKALVGVYSSRSPGNASLPSTVTILRLAAFGGLDESFGSEGKVTLPGLSGFAPSSVPFDEQPPPPVRVKLQLTADGHVLVLGSSLVRLDGDGAIDTTFGSAGTATLPPSFSPAGLALAPDGSTVVVGTTTTGSGTQGAVVRVTAAGRLDKTFGTAGSGIVSIPQVADSRGRPLTSVSYRGVAVAPDGSITLAGVGQIATPESVAPRHGLLARLTAAGTLDQRFGAGGMVHVERYGGIRSFNSFEPGTLRLTPDGHALIVAAVGRHFLRSVPTLLSFDPAGRPPPPEASEYGCSSCEQSLGLAEAPDGRLLATASEGDLVLEGFTPGLSQIVTLGRSDSGSDIVGGGALAQLPGEAEVIGNGVMLQDGRLLVAGTVPGSGTAFVARLFGLSQAPPPRVTAARHAGVAGRAVSVLLHCPGYASCRGTAELELPRRTARGTRSLLVAGHGHFELAGGVSAPVVIRLTRAVASFLGHRGATRAAVRIQLRGGGRTSAAVVVAALPRSTALVPIASAINVFETDGRRYLVYRDGTLLHALDTFTGHEFSAPVPRRCRSPQLEGVSFPMVLLACESIAELVNIAAGHARPLPPAGSENWRAIGRYWVGPSQAEPCHDYYVCELYYNWHTGATRRIDTPPLAHPNTIGFMNEVLARDLDARRLTPVAPCPPLQPSNLETSLLAYRSLYARPYVLFGTAVDPENGDPMNSGPHVPTGLFLGRCGSGAGTVLDVQATRSPPQHEPQGDELGGGIVTWYSPGQTTASAYEISRGRRIQWAAPYAPKGFKLPMTVSHTGNAAIIAVASHQICEEASCSTDAWTLYRAAIRRR